MGRCVRKGMTSVPRGRVRVEQGAKRVRAYLGGELVADTTRPLLVWEVPYYPTYYLPTADVARRARAHRRGRPLPQPGRRRRADRAHRHGRGARRRPALRREPHRRAAGPRAPRLGRHGRLVRGGCAGLHPRAQPVHPGRHPAHARARSSCTLGDTELARSTHAHALFETGLPTRWYLPRVDVRMDLLSPSPTVTHCPYKGQTEHFSARVGDETVDDVAWSYPTPLPESERVAGLVAFYDRPGHGHRRRRAPGLTGGGRGAGLASGPASRRLPGTATRQGRPRRRDVSPPAPGRRTARSRSRRG